MATWGMMKYMQYALGDKIFNLLVILLSIGLITQYTIIINSYQVILRLLSLNDQYNSVF